MDFDKIIGIVMILLSIFIMGFYTSCVSKIPPDENAVLFKPFDGGVDKETIYMPGTHITAPWDQLITYNISTKEGATKMSNLSKDKIVYEIEFNYQYRVEPSKLGYLHEEIGANYHEIVIIPALQNGVEEMLGRWLSKDISAIDNERIEAEIKARSKRAIREKYLILESVSIQKIVAQ